MRTKFYLPKITSSISVHENSQYTNAETAIMIMKKTKNFWRRVAISSGLVW